MQTSYILSGVALILATTLLAAPASNEKSGAEQEPIESTGHPETVGGVIHSAISLCGKTGGTMFRARAIVVGNSLSREHLFELFAENWLSSAYDNCLLMPSRNLQLGGLMCEPTFLETSQELTIVLEQDNETDADSVKLQLPYGQRGGFLSTRSDEAAKLIYDLHGNPPEDFPNNGDGEMLRIHLFDGEWEGGWNKDPKCNCSKLQCHVEFYLSVNSGGEEGEGGTLVNGDSNSSIPYFAYRTEIERRFSICESFIHPTIGLRPSDTLNGVSIDNFMSIGNNIVYAQLFTFCDINGNNVYDPCEDCLVGRSPFTTLRVKLDKDAITTN